MRLGSTSGITITLRAITNTSTGEEWLAAAAASQPILVDFGEELRVAFEVCDQGYIYNSYKRAGYNDNEIPLSVPYSTTWEYILGSVIVSEGYGPAGSLARDSCVSARILFPITAYKNYRSGSIYFDFRLQLGSTPSAVAIFSTDFSIINKASSILVSVEKAVYNIGETVRGTVRCLGPTGQGINNVRVSGRVRNVETNTITTSNIVGYTNTHGDIGFLIEANSTNFPHAGQYLLEFADNLNFA
ncbi:MAG: hypothetical protein QXF17_01405 [Ignisphaera sp.]